MPVYIKKGGKYVEYKLPKLYQECDDCGGNGETECDQCGGGFTSCETCEGSGKEGDGPDHCPDCEGKGEIKCETCDGKVNIKCSPCKGEGYRKAEDLGELLEDAAA